MTTTTERLDDVWRHVDFPVLVEAVRRLNAGDRYVRSNAIASAIELEEPAVVAALVRLSTRYLDVKVTRAMGGQVVVCAVITVTEDGLREVGMWPSAEVAADRLLEALAALIDNTADGSPKQRRIKAARDSLLAAGRDVLVEVAGTAISGRIPVA